MNLWFKRLLRPLLLLLLAFAAGARRNCAATAGRCARWRSRPTASSAISGSFDTSAIRWSLERNVAEQVMRFHDSGGERGRLAQGRPHRHRRRRRAYRDLDAGPAGARQSARRPQRPDRRAGGVAGRQRCSRPPRGITPCGCGRSTAARRACWKAIAQNVNGVAFTPDGSELVSAGYDATLRIWPLSDGSVRSFARCRRRSIPWRSRPTARSSPPAPTARSISCRRRASCAAKLQARRRRSSRWRSRPTASSSPPPASAVRWR